MRPASAAALAGLLPAAVAIFFQQSPGVIISAAQAGMQASAADPAAQLAGCLRLEALAETDRGEPGPFGGRKVATAYLDAGIGQAFATGLANAVAIDAAKGRTSPGLAARTCILGIYSLTVQNDREMGLRLIQTSPDLWPAIVSYYRTFKEDRSVIGSIVMLAGLFGTPQPRQAVCGLVEAGGIDLVLELLDQRSVVVADPALFQSLLAALSDNVQADRCAAVAIANYGGPLQGIKLMVQAMSWTRESDVTFHEANGFGLLYEVVHDTTGILRHDDASHTFAKALVQAGYLEQLVPVMKLQPLDGSLQVNGCSAISLVLQGDSAARARLIELGAAEHIASDIVQLAQGPAGPDSELCKMFGTCSAVLHELGRDVGESERLAASACG